MKSVLAYFTAHRTAANLVAALMLLAGLYAGLNIRLQYFPDIVAEQVSVTVAWPGAGPEEVDRQIVERLEPALIVVDGVEEVASRATEGRARVTLSFEPGHDMARALEGAQAAVDGVRDLPDAAEAPEIVVSSYRDTVTDVVIWGDAPRESLARIAGELQSRLFAEGVTRTRLRGAPDPVIRVAVREAELVRHDIGLDEIADRIAGAASSAPAGEIADGGLRLRAGAESRSVEAIAEIPLRVAAGGGRLLVRDVAEVFVEGAESGEAWYVGEKPAVTLVVERSAQGDAVRIQAAVEAAVAAMRPTLPEGVDAQLRNTRAEAISDRLDLLVTNGLTGLALVLALLFLFLSARTAVWVAVGIPVALSAALAAMWAMGITLNMISLFALIICLGIVVDDAIVVGEHADHLARRGRSPTQAAREAAERMLAPVFAASITTVIAFLALAVVGGRFGALILAIPLTVTAVLLASLAESFLVLPAHMRHALSAKRRAPWYDAPSRKVDRGFRRFRDRAFRPFTRQAVRLRWPVLGGALGLLLWSLTLLTEGHVPWRFFDAPERSQGSINFTMSPGATRAETEAMLAETSRALEATAERFRAADGGPATTSRLGVVGDVIGRAPDWAEGKDDDLLGGLKAEFVDPDARDWPVSEFLRAWEAEVRPHPMVETISGRGEQVGPGGDALSIDLIGRDPRTLKAAAEEVKAELSRLGPVSGLEDTLPYDAEQLILTPTPLGLSLGLDAAALGAALRDRLTGIEAAGFPIDGRAATVLVSLPEAALTADYLDRARIRAPGGGWAALSDVAGAERTPGFAAISRRDGFPSLTVSGEIDPTDPAAAARVIEALEARILPAAAARHDVDWRLSGLAEQEREFLADARLGLWLCLAGIYVTLAWVFASWTRPLVVLLAAPLGLIGVLWGHHWMDVSLSMFSVVGLIGMIGIVINDSIVLVTTVDEHARERALIPAIIDAASDRLRAVFLTTATTVAGLAPLLFETSTQAQFLMPTVVTLAFGLGFGMVLVLVVTPAALAAQGDLERLAGSARRLAKAAAAGRLRGRLNRSR